ncbi:TolC family protein [Bacteriovorax sp. Seq25_V]|uniref:TolC family protein n=1 Tax=Bacteriovorax sp. Seq25_V TaxID=1201288 RepID=UPI000389FA2B|nr:TolC family protein [Bacteriovorax sp. Seq25_V]EQC46129.1 hypothetical protein M900_1833 [Bacteriovorax sp. Seq25_V]
MKRTLTVLCNMLVAYNISANCKINSPREIYQLIKSNHPNIKANQTSLANANIDIEIASTISNPRLEVEREINGEKTTEVSIMQKFELGGKRQNRISLAKKNNELQKNIIDFENQEILIETILDIHELHRLNEILPLYTESLEAFKKILDSLAKSKTLSPEKIVERDTLELVISDYKFKISKLSSEKKEKEGLIRFKAQTNCKLTSSAFNLDLRSWKELSPTKDLSNYPKLKLINSKLETSIYSYELERSQSYPDIEIGPKVILDNREKIYGVNISFDIPVFNQNTARKERMLKNLNLTRAIKKSSEEETAIRYQSWITKYQDLLETLEKIGSQRSFEEKHKRMEKLFKRGIISTNLVIETHRQLIEFSETRHDLEHGLIEAYLKINEFHGTLDSFKF